MKVSIIDQELNHPKRYQIMKQSGSGFYHLHPGKLYTLEEAKAICTANGYTVESIGSIWKCIK